MDSSEEARRERAVVYAVVTRIEKKRVLYQNPNREVSNHVVGSVLDMRDALTDEIAKGPLPSRVDPSVRALRTACVDLLESWQPQIPRDLDLSSGEFYFDIGNQGRTALSSFQRKVHKQIRAMCELTGVQVEDPLASHVWG